MITLNALAMLLVALPAGGLPSGIGPLRTDSENLVLIIPGNEGVDEQLRFFAMNLGESIARTNETQMRIWDWTRIALKRERPAAKQKSRAKDRRKLPSPSRDPKVSRGLAKLIADWRQVRPDAKLYLMGVGEGSEVILEACRASDSDRAIIPEKSVKRVIFFGATLPSDVELAPIVRVCEEPIYNYASSRDSLLEYRKVKVAGFRGFKESARVVQLQWHPGFRKLGNHGDHYQWTNKFFADKYVLPLLGKPTIELPVEWRP